MQNRSSVFLPLGHVYGTLIGAAARHRCPLSRGEIVIPLTNDRNLKADVALKRGNERRDRDGRTENGGVASERHRQRFIERL